MRGRWTYWRRTVAAAVLLPLVVLASSFAHDLMRCRLTGVIVPTCACPEETMPSGSDAALPTAAEQSCCERESVVGLAVGREEISRAVVPIPVPVALRGLLLAAFGVTSRPIGLAGARCRRPSGPPLILLKRSFLI